MCISLSVDFDKVKKNKGEIGSHTGNLYVKASFHKQANVDTQEEKEQGKNVIKSIILSGNSREAEKHINAIN